MNERMDERMNGVTTSLLELLIAATNNEKDAFFNNNKKFKGLAILLKMSFIPKVCMFSEWLEICDFMHPIILYLHLIFMP